MPAAHTVPKLQFFQWVRERLAPLPPRCREGVNSPYLPTCLFQAQVFISGGPNQSTPYGELSVLTYAG
uniref:Uncharacterized protein n=1 Tax=Candidatus Kentrum sp. DK TaxID=2126562 RepID=A0A450SD22_9GAMM|nr:MAG: hypothetical protein BECKDK2373C_GA0170839_102839 [Candidatus Kentron sp. DK]